MGTLCKNCPFKGVKRTEGSWVYPVEDKAAKMNSRNR